jgi:hypothetical protein
MSLNVFIDIVIEFHHHFLIVKFLPCTPTYTFFFLTLYNDSLPNMLYHYVPFFPFLLIHSNFHTIYPYFSRLYITPHSTFYVVTGCAEHSGAQVLFYKNSWLPEKQNSLYHTCRAASTLPGQIINKNRKMMFVLEKNNFLKFDFW